MKHLSLSLIRLRLQSILSDIGISMPPCFLVPSDWSILVHLFTLRWCLSLKLRRISYRQQMGGFCFLIHSSSLWLLRIGLGSLIFKASGEVCVLIKVIGLLIFWCCYLCSQWYLCFHNYNFVFLSIVLDCSYLTLQCYFQYFPKVWLV